MPRGRKGKARRTKKRSSSAPPSLESPKKRLKWSNDNMELALDAVIQACSVRRAAVSRTTLQDRISGKVVHGTKPGPLPYFDKAEEADLAEFIEVVSVNFAK